MSDVERFRFLASAALSDGTIAPEERSVLVEAAKEMGVPEGEIDQILVEVGEGKGAAAIPNDPGERAKLFRSTVDLIAADGVIEAHEEAFLERVAPHFGLHEIEVEDILRSVIAAKKGKR